MSGKLDYINMIKKVSPYNLKKGILYLLPLWTERILDKINRTFPEKRY